MITSYIYIYIYIFFFFFFFGGGGGGRGSCKKVDHFSVSFLYILGLFLKVQNGNDCLGR